MTKLLKYLPWVLVVGINFLLSNSLRYSNSCTLNSGFAFGMQFLYFQLVSIILLIILIYIAIKSKGFVRYNVLVISILGLGNLLERFIYTDICDYITILNISVNIIDISIVIGVITLIIFFIKELYANNHRTGK